MGARDEHRLSGCPTSVCGSWTITPVPISVTGRRPPLKDTASERPGSAAQAQAQAAGSRAHHAPAAARQVLPPGTWPAPPGPLQALFSDATVPAQQGPEVCLQRTQQAQRASVTCRGHLAQVLPQAQVHNHTGAALRSRVGF